MTSIDNIKTRFLNNVAVLWQVFSMRYICLLFLCFAVAFIPYTAFGEWDLIYIIVIDLVLLGVGFRFLAGYRKHILFFLVSLFVFLVAGEVYFRLSNFGTEGMSLKEYCPAGYGNPLSNLEYDPGTYTGLKPGSSVRFKTKMLTVNKRGFRGKDYSYEKPKGVYRILFVGASVTMGSAVGDGERFTDIIENKFKNSDLSLLPSKPDVVEVINLSIPGSHLGNLVHVFKHEGVKYDPDMVMFMASKGVERKGELKLEQRKAHAYEGSKHELIMNSRYSYFRNRFFFARLLLMCRRGELVINNGDRNFLPSWAFGLIKEEEVEADPVDFERMAETRPQFISFLEAVNEMKDDFKTVLYVQKPLTELANPQHNIDYRKFVKHCASGYGFEVVDAYEVDFSGYTVDDLRVYPCENHPNEIAHKIYADYMYNRIVDIMKKKDDLAERRMQ